MQKNTRYKTNKIVSNKYKVQKLFFLSKQDFTKLFLFSTFVQQLKSK